MSEAPPPRSWTEADSRCRGRHEVISVMAFTAALLQLGADPDEIDAAWFTVKTYQAPRIPSEFVDVAQRVLEQVRRERRWLG